MSGIRDLIVVSASVLAFSAVADADTCGRSAPKALIWP
jgi:hypothetical protein